MSATGGTKASYPRRLWPRRFGDIGLLGMHLQGYGCAGTSATAYGLACLELEAGDSGIRSLCFRPGLAGHVPDLEVRLRGAEADMAPRDGGGEVIGCFGLTEPDSGSDPASMRTSARRDGSDWVINGTKMWITNGSIADVAVVWARTDDGSGASSSPPTPPGSRPTRSRRRRRCGHRSPRS